MKNIKEIQRQQVINFLLKEDFTREEISQWIDDYNEVAVQLLILGYEDEEIIEIFPFFKDLEVFKTEPVQVSNLDNFLKNLKK